MLSTNRSNSRGTVSVLGKLAGTLDVGVRRRIAWLRTLRSVEGRLAWGIICDVHRDSLIELGTGSSIGHGTILSIESSPLGRGTLTVGADTWIGEYNSFHSAGADIRIGSHCLVSQFVSLVATGHEYRDARVPIREQGISFAHGITVGDDVWIGAGASIMPGVTIGDGAVVASGAVVTRNVPRFAIVSGNPGEVLSKRHHREEAGCGLAERNPS